MKIGAQAHHSTSISTSNESVIVVRGRNLTDELIGRINFTDHFWLLLTGDLPSAAQRTVWPARSARRASGSARGPRPRTLIRMCDYLIGQEEQDKVTLLSMTLPAGELS